MNSVHKTYLTLSLIAVIGLAIFGYFFLGGVFGGTTFGVSLKTQTDLEDGLVGHWTFDGKDYEITRATDRSGNGNDGFLTELNLTSAESTTDWGVNDGSIATDSDRVEGSTSLKLTATAADGRMKYNPAGTWDLSSYRYIVFWAKSGTGAAINDGELFLFKDTGTTDFFRWNFTYPADWGPVVIDLANPNDTTGSPSLTSIDRIRFDVNTSGNSGLIDIVVATDKDKAVPGKIGQALQFDGVDDFVNAGNASSLTLEDRFTLVAWINPSTVSGQHVIMAKHAGTQGYGFSVVGGKIQFGHNTGPFPTGNTTIPTDEWSHVVVTVDNGPDEVFFYFNGAPDGSDTSTTFNISSGSQSLLMGKLRVSDSIQFFVGIIDDVRIYNRVLSAEEIKRLYQLGATTKIGKTIKTQTDLEDGLVGHWTFDGEDLIENVVDRSGQGNTGYLTNFTSTTTAIGKIGQALDFDGVDDYVSITAGSSSLNLTNGGTWGAWVKAEPQSGITKSIISQGGWDTKYDLGYIHDGNNNVRCQVNAGADGEARVTFDLTDGWHHVMCVFDGTNLFNYIDGVLRKTVAGTLDSSTSEVFIGSDPTGRDFNGLIDDVRIYNRALSPDEITRLYQLGATTKIGKTIKTQTDLESGLVGHWTFDGPDLINNAVDRSGQGNTGYLTGFTSTTTAIGKIGQALDFDGSDDYIQLNDPSSLNISGDITVATWFRFSTSQNNRPIVSRWGTDESYLLTINFGGGNDNELTFCIRVANVNKCATTTNTYNDGEWHHAVGRFNGSNVLLTIDGGVEDITGASTSGPIDTPAQNVVIGVYNNPLNFFIGSIDDVRIYNRALSSDEIKRLYDLGR